MSAGEWVCFWVFLILGAFNIWLLAASVWDYFRDKRKIRAVGRAKPVVNALQDYHEFKARLRAEARDGWSDEYRRLVSLGATKKQYIAACRKAHVSWVEGNGWQVTPPDFDTRVRADTVEDRAISDRVAVYGYAFPPNPYEPHDYGVV